MAINKLNPIEGGIPKGNTANRSVEFPSPQIGDVYYNGQLEILEIYNGTTWVAVSAPPSTPQIISVTDSSTGDDYTSTAGKIAILFQAGIGGGTPSQYNAFTVSGGHSASSSTTTVTLTGLTPGTSYEVYGNGQNNFGTTVNTPNQAAITPTTRPQAPTIGTATASANNTGEVTVTWTLGNNGGKNLTSITITPYLNGITAETPRIAATTSSTSYTFTDGQLTKGSSYTFKVKATNANGNSPESAASNSAITPNYISVSYLVIAGGGGGGTPNGGGGGGAGGYRTNLSGQTSGRGSSAEAALVINAGTQYNITVGSGGAGGNAADSKGGNSVFSTITSEGGGAGGDSDSSTQVAPGGNGGSGGGAGSTSSGSFSGGGGTSNQGFDGGTGGSDGSTWRSGGGGGGASGNGTNGSSGNGGIGGSGISSNITGSVITRAGGGGGGVYNASSGGAGGNGGGGNGGGIGNTGGSGSLNTGSGGGGGGRDNAGQNGGSGVVILRWLTSQGTISVGAGLTADATGTDGSYSYKRFTAGSGNVSFS